MRTGVLLPHSLSTSSSHDIVAWARTAEDMGFDSLGVRGRIVHDSLEPLVALSLVAASTRRIELLLHLPNVRRARPIILTRQLSGLERASRRRLTLAAGAAENTWAIAGRDGRRRCLAVVDAFQTGDAGVTGVRDALDACERAGADDVLLAPTSNDLRALERLVDLRAPALV
jgi:alkanesulfonate monooxygenase SsuD/methylene tetrahydromethanopterin reductase-like flavin-dependent oxidoreductase (luciferase family)